MLNLKTHIFELLFILAGFLANTESAFKESISSMPFPSYSSLFAGRNLVVVDCTLVGVLGYDSGHIAMSGIAAACYYMR
jgi:hypothetical protein